MSMLGDVAAVLTGVAALFSAAAGLFETVQRWTKRDRGGPQDSGG